MALSDPPDNNSGVSNPQELSTLGITSPRSFAARPRTVAAFVAAGVVAGFLGLTLDAAGRILLFGLAIALLSEGLWLLLVRPVLTMGPDGVRARSGFHVVSAPWDEVGSVQARPAR